MSDKRARCSEKAYAAILAMAKKQKVSMSKVIDQLLAKKK
jgi:hypothetical protein